MKVRNKELITKRIESKQHGEEEIMKEQQQQQQN